MSRSPTSRIWKITSGSWCSIPGSTCRSKPWTSCHQVQSSWWFGGRQVGGRALGWPLLRSPQPPKVLCWGKVCSVGSSSRLGGWRRRSPGQGDGRHQACHKRGSCEGPGNLPDGETCAPRPRCQGCCPAATSHFEVGGAPSPRSTSFPIGSPEKTEGRSRIHRMISCLFLQRLFVLSSLIDLILKE